MWEVWYIQLEKYCKYNSKLLEWIITLLKYFLDTMFFNKIYRKLVFETLNILLISSDTNSIHRFNHLFIKFAQWK
jgi:hypothetical protein